MRRINFRFPRSLIIFAVASAALLLFGFKQWRAAETSRNLGNQRLASGISEDALAAGKQDVDLATTRWMAKVFPEKRYLGSSGEPLLPISTLVQMLDAVPSDGDGSEIVGILRAILADRAAYADTLPAVVPIITKLLRERKKIPADSRKVYSTNGVSVPLGWATYLMPIVVGEIAWGNQQLPPLDQQEGHASSDGKARGAAVYALLEAGLDYPTIAGYTFSLLDRCKLGLKISPGVLEQLAVHATKTRFKLWNESPRLHSGAFFSSYSYTSTAGRIPEIALADLMANRDIASRLAIYSKLGNGTIGNYESAVGLASAIAAAEEGEVEELFARASDSLPVAIPERLAFLTSLRWLVAIAAPEGSASLNATDQFLLKEYELAIRQRRGFGRGILAKIAKRKAVGGDSEAVTAWVLKVLEELNGSDGPLPENFDMMSEASKSFLRGIADGRDAPFATIFALGKLPFPLPSNIVSDIERLIARHAKFQTADEALEELDNLGIWTRPWAELGMTWESEYGNPSVWARLFQNQRMNFATKSQFILTLDEAGGETRFRKQFAAACINGDKARMLTLIEGAIVELDSLTGADREGFASALKAWFPYYSAAGAPEEVKAFFRSLGGGVVKADLEEAQALLDNGLHKIDLGYSGREILSAKIPGFIFSDAGVAAKLMAGLLEELHRRENDPLDIGRYSGHSSSEGFPLHAADAFYGDVAEACGDSDLETEDFIQFLAELAKHDAERLLGAQNRDYWQVRELMRRGWERWALEESGVEDTQPGAATWTYVRNKFSSESDAFKSSLVNQTLLQARSLRWNHPSPQETRNWLEETEKEELDPIFVRGCRALVAIRSWHFLQGSMKEKAIDAWVGLLGDAELSSRERLELMWSASEKRGLLLEEVAIRDAVGELLESYLDERRPVDSPVVHGIISRLGEHISDADQFDWGAFATRFAPLIFGAKAPDTSPEVRDSFRLPLAKLSLGGGADDIAADLVDTGHRVEGDLSTVLNFAALGRLEVAAKMAESLPGHFSIPDLAWTPQIAQDLQKLLRKIGDDGEKYRIECLVSALADAPDIEIDERRDDRLSRLAAEFHKRAPDDLVKRNACLVALVNSQGHRMTAATLEDEIAAVASEWTLAEVLESGKLSWGAAEDISLIIYVAVSNAAWETGDISVAARQLESLFVSGGGVMDESYESKLVSCAGFYISDYLSYLERIGKPVSERVLSQSEAWLQLAASGGRRNIIAQRGALGIAVALHAIAGKGAKLDEFLASLDSSEKEIYERVLSNSPDLSTMWSTGWWRQERKEPARRRYLRSFANDRATSAREFQSPIDMARLIRSKTILPDEFVSEVALLPDDTFHLEWWKLIAAYQRALSDSRTREASLAELESICTNASAAGDPILAACALGYRAIATAGAWDTKEELETASELMQLVDLEALPESEKRSFEVYLKMWQNHMIDL